MPLENIVVRGAREHNLKDIDVTIPRDKLVVITGVSGSGKSSLAFDTIYAEGQRRYVESLSAYARQFLGRMDKPEVDYIEGLSPAISIDQKGVSRNPRSTVGTVTEVYDYLRLLFARVGHPHCYSCGRPVESQTVQQMVDAIIDLPDRTRIQILAPMVRRRKGEHKEVFEDARRAGFVRVRVNGETRDLSENITLQKTKWHDIEVIVDRLVIDEGLEQSRVADSVESALKLAGGTVLVNVVDGDDLLFSEEFACVHCNISLGEMEPRTFSFNNPHGACQRCSGLGYKLEVDPDLVIPNKDLSLVEGAIQPWMRSGTADTWMMSLLTAVADEYGFSTREPLNRFTEEQIDVLLHGTGKSRVRVQHRTKRGRMHRWDTAFEGVVNNLERRYRQTESDMIRAEIERYMSQRECQNCNGQRLKPEALAVTIGGCNIIDVTSRSIEHALDWISAITRRRRLAFEWRALPSPSHGRDNGSGANGASEDAGRYRRHVRAVPQQPRTAQEPRRQAHRQRRPAHPFRARNDHRLAGPQGDRGAASLPLRHRPRLPHPRTHRLDPQRRRGPAHPARDADRFRPHRRPLRLR